MHEIIDATPVSNWAYLIPKAAAVVLVLLSTLIVSVAAAITFQLLKGHTQLELGQYLKWYLLPAGYDLALVGILAIFVQAISPNKYVGWGLMVLYLVSTLVLSSFGLEHKLYQFGGTPDEPLSDMNGAGSYGEAAWWFRIYWGAFSVLLLIGVHILWPRGTETRLRSRLGRLRSRLRGPSGLVALAVLGVFAATGGWIFYNTTVLNHYRTAAGEEAYLAEYERRYLQYENFPQPTIAHVELDVALYPDEPRAVTSGRYRLVNLTDQPISFVHVRNMDRITNLTSLQLQGAGLWKDDSDWGYRIFRFGVAMRPGEARDLRFRSVRKQAGFVNSGADTRLVENGTFLTNYELAPLIGMSRLNLLEDRKVRRKHGLAPELRPAVLEDPAATARNYAGADWTTAKVTVSTSGDQTPIAPGTKVADKVRGGRRIATYVSEAPILTFFSIQSARYAEKRRRHEGVDLAVYYHPGHVWNVDRMLRAMTVGLDYFVANFGPYQFKEARITEFPGYARYAQAFANTMPFSETVGFIADNRNAAGIDYVTYVTAHELAHQWWGHQLIGADTQGGSMLSETLAQYSALMVMKRLYGEDQIRQFLKYELDEYLSGRGGEGIEEVPLARVEKQSYIHYNKGSLVMYLLQERLGEHAVNRALRSLLEAHRFKGRPYPRSVDFVRRLRAEAKSEEEQTLITDLFERITLFEFKTEGATTVRRTDGRWDVAIPVEAHKYYADGQGREQEANLSDRVAIGIFSAMPGAAGFSRQNVLMLEARPLRSGAQVIRIVTDQRPSHVGVDPYNFYIDRNPDDNIGTVN